MRKLYVNISCQSLPTGQAKYDKKKKVTEEKGGLKKVKVF